jgi:hypothetical protein
MGAELREQCANLTTEAPRGRSPGWLFVSTSLATWTTASPEQFARDFQINDTVYRRLDPKYYAWLRSRMVLAKKAATDGQLDAAAFENLRVRFNAVHEWALEHFGEVQLLEAVRTIRTSDYKPPTPEDDGPRVTAPPPRKSSGDHISRDAIAMVDAIREQALSLGWKRERLYGTGGNGAFDPQRGLVCFLKTGDRIGEITAQSIEIILPQPSEVRHRFYNPDVDQPSGEENRAHGGRKSQNGRARGVLVGEGSVRTASAKRTPRRIPPQYPRAGTLANLLPASLIGCVSLHAESNRALQR